MTLGLVLILTLSGMIIAGGVWTYFSEKKLWNSGHCPRCRTLWEIRRTEEGHIYRCPSCGLEKESAISRFDLTVGDQ